MRWLPAWLIKSNKLFTLVFTWHRASGLWVWLMFLIFAWSAVALNLGEVYEPVMGALLGSPEEEEELPELATPKPQALAWREVHEIGRRLMAAEASRRSFEIFGERGLHYEPNHGVYGYSVESSLDLSERLADTAVSFDDQGRLLSFSAPTGQALGGELVVSAHDRASDPDRRLERRRCSSIRRGRYDWRGRSGIG